MIKWKKSGAPLNGKSRARKRSTSKSTAASILRLPASQSTTARMSSSPAHRFFTRQITQKPSARCAETRSATKPTARSRRPRPVQPLGDERFHNRGEQERLHVHVEQTRDAADRVVRMQRAEDEVPGHRRADGDVGGLDIANFTDHHDVWILSQNVAQPFGKGEVDLRLHVNLRNAGEPIFHRFLDRDDPALDRINGGEKAVKRSRFAAAGRP